MHFQSRRRCWFGGIRIAEKPQDDKEAEQAQGKFDNWGIEFHLLGPDSPGRGKFSRQSRRT